MKEPVKQKVTLEFPLQCTMSSLFKAVSTGAGLQSWFADQVIVDGDRFIFVWNKEPQAACQVYIKNNVCARYQWEEESEDYYFEMGIVYQELTGDIILTITDFAEDGECEDCELLWNVQVAQLKRAIGCPKN